MEFDGRIEQGKKQCREKDKAGKKQCREKDKAGKKQSREKDKAGKKQSREKTKQVKQCSIFALFLRCCVLPSNSIGWSAVPQCSVFAVFFEMLYSAVRSHWMVGAATLIAGLEKVAPPQGRLAETCTEAAGRFYICVACVTARATPEQVAPFFAPRRESD